jgi:hypothetical protein
MDDGMLSGKLLHCKSMICSNSPFVKDFSLAYDLSMTT